MKKCYLLILVAILTGCQREEILPASNDLVTSGMEEVALQEIPSYIQEFINKADFNKTNDKKSNNYSIFGKAKTDVPSKKIKKENGFFSYTIPLEKLNKDAESGKYYFDNLVIDEISHDKSTVKILRYKPDPKWYYSDKRNSEPFSGMIEFYTVDGEFTGEIKLDNGVKVMERGSNKEWVTTCNYEVDSWICTGGDCMYTIVESCSTTYVIDDGSGSGGGGSYTEPEPDYSGGGGSGGTTTSPIPEEEEVVSVDRETSFTEVEKINCTYEQLIKAGSLEEILRDFFGEDAMFNITYSVVQDLECNGKTDVTGCATQLDDYNYLAQFDESYILNERTPTIFLAQSIIHESIHANLYAAVVKHNNGILPVDKSFEALYNDYREIKGWQHEMMADHYTTIMEKAIRAVHPYLNDGNFFSWYEDNADWNWDEFYEYISYRGLQNTESGKLFFGDDTNNVSFYSNGAESFSTKKPVCDEKSLELEPVIDPVIDYGDGEVLK